MSATPWNADWEKSYSTASNSQLSYSLSDVDAGFAVGDVNGAAIYLPIPSWSEQDTTLSGDDLFLLTNIPRLAEQLGLDASASATLSATAIAVDPLSQTAHVPVFVVLQDEQAQALASALLELPARSSLTTADLSLDQFTFYPDFLATDLELAEAGDGIVVAGADLGLITNSAGQASLLTTATRLRFDSDLGTDQSWTQALEPQIGAQFGDLALLSNGDAVISGLRLAANQIFNDSGFDIYDVNLARFDTAGQRVWPEEDVDPAPTALLDKSWGISPQLAVDPADNIYLAATVFGSYGPFNSASQSLDRSIGITKFSPDGDELWKYRLGDGFALSSSEDGLHEVRDLLIAPDGSLLVLGTIYQTEGEFHGSTSLGGGTDRDAFITALSPDGERLWTHRFGSADVDLPSSFAFMPLDRNGVGSVNTLVVSGEQQPEGDASSRGWLHLLDYDAISTFYQQPSEAPLPLPDLDWALVSQRSDAAPYSLEISGQASPGASIELFYSLAQEQSSTTSSFVRLPSVQADATGLWQISEGLGEYIPPTQSNQASRVLLFADTGASGRSRSDSELSLITPEGALLPGQSDPVTGLRYPEAFWVAPADVGVSSSRTSVPLLRSVLSEGSGAPLFVGQTILADYTGKLLDGTVFDSSLDPGDLPFGFDVGTGSVIQGWHYGLLGGAPSSSQQDPVRLGSDLQLVIPAELSYWDDASNAKIPAYSSLQFDVTPRVDLTVPFDWFQNRVESDMALISTVDYSDELIALGLGGVDPTRKKRDWLSLSTNRGIYALEVPELPGPFNGDAGNDIHRLSLPTTVASGIKPDILDWGFPLAVLGASGDDQLSTTTTSGLFFGEAGDDLIQAGSSAYSYLDGGEDHDRLEIDTSPLTWSNGGLGNDILDLNGGNWEILDSLVFNEFTGYAPTYKLGERAPDDPTRFSRIAYVQGVEDLEGISSLKGNASDLLLFLDRLTERSSASSLLKLSVDDSSLTTTTLSALLNAAAVEVDITSVTRLEGSADELIKLLSQLIDQDPSSYASTLRLMASDAVLSTDQILQLLGLTQGEVELSGLSKLNGMPEQLDALLPVTGTLHGFARLQFPAPQPPVLSAPSNGIYQSSDLLDFRFDFGEPLAIKGNPLLRIGSQDVALNRSQSKPADGELVFSYVPDSSDDTHDLTFSAEDLISSPDDAIYDALGRQVISLTDFNAEISIQTPPEIIDVHIPLHGSFLPSDTIPVSLEFSEPVRFSPSRSPAALQLLHGSQLIDASHITTDPNRLSRYQSFDLVVGDLDQISAGDPLQVSSLMANGDVVDGFGLVSTNSLSAVSSNSFPVRFIETDWSLDVDRDGQYSALGDGLMILRYLFGSAFRNESLVANALSPNSPYQSSDWELIASHIQQGVDLGLLDVDRDGQETALGDGLMIIRHLFGAFEGQSLIVNAYSSSPSLEHSLLGRLHGDASGLVDDLGDHIAANIDRLML